jgi:hypothetical protein
MVIVTASNLSVGGVKSCGCLRRDTKNGLTHGLYGTRTYGIWNQMIMRCHNPNSISFPYYGARGIRVCDRWRQSVESFVADMGLAPANKSIDRIDNDGPYEPANCRWATQLEQHANRSDNRRLTHNGETLTIAEWSRRSGISPALLWHRVTTMGWTHSEAISTPARRCVRRH